MPGGHRGSILGKVPWGAAEEERGGLQGELRAEANVDKGAGGSRHGGRQHCSGIQWKVGKGEAEQAGE